ncbi:MAG: TadE family protein [Pseudomonadota bacterium]
MIEPLRNMKAKGPDLKSDESGIAFMEFALMMPVFLSFILVAIEFGNYMVAAQKIDKLAFISADMVARATLPPDEGQMADTLQSIHSASLPFELRRDGRVIITGLLGIENDNKELANRLVWQRCEGRMANIASQFGKEDGQEAKDREGVTLPQNIVLPQGQMVIVAEVAYDYQPIISEPIFDTVGVNREFRSVSVLRTRGKGYDALTPNPEVEAKICDDDESGGGSITA